MHTLTTALAQINTEARALFGQGKVADYIPALAQVPPRQFGMAVALVDGSMFHVGDAHTPFSLQSITSAVYLCAGAQGHRRRPVEARRPRALGRGV